MGVNRLAEVGRERGSQEPAAGAFVLCPAAFVPGGWQWQVYQAAYAEALAVQKPLPPVLAGMVSSN